MNLTQNNEIETAIENPNDDLAARICALNLIGKVLNKRNTLDVALESSSEFARLPPRDRAFARMLLSTTIRRLGQIDDLITYAQERPDALKTDVVRNILRLGITQIFFMEVADYAVVDTCVRMVEEKNMPRQKGFINAMLRTLIKKGAVRIEKQDAPRLNTPDWLLKIWIEDYGLNIAAKIAQANMSEAPLDITVKDITERPYWGNILQASELSTGTLRRVIGGKNIRNMEGFESGKWWVQDAAAAIPVLLFGNVEGKRIVDLCAAPGGKTLQLASLGANVTAVDRSAKRLKRLEENLERMGLKDRVRIEIADAASWKIAQKPERILLDAPCSATGTIRRHPDTGYLKSVQDIASLMSVQERLLNRAGEILAIGGVLIYCTCSLQKSEGEHQIEKFLNNNANFKRINVKSHEIGDYEELINDSGDLRILPYHLSNQGGMDGFFVSRLIKTG